MHAIDGIYNVDLDWRKLPHQFESFGIPRLVEVWGEKKLVWALGWDFNACCFSKVSLCGVWDMALKHSITIAWDTFPCISGNIKCACLRTTPVDSYLGWEVGWGNFLMVVDFELVVAQALFWVSLTDSFVMDIGACGWGGFICTCLCLGTHFEVLPW